MAKERRYARTINISHLPEIVRLTKEAKKARRPIRLTIDDQDAGILMPPRQADTFALPKTSDSPTQTGPKRRSQLLAGFGAVTPTRKPENWLAVREEVEQAI